MLCGMKWVRFYDLDGAKRGAERIDVWDSSFLEDMDEVCTSEKSDGSLRGLVSLFPRNTSSLAYTPTDNDWSIINRWSLVNNWSLVDNWSIVNGWYGDGDQVLLAYDDLFKLCLHKDRLLVLRMGDREP